jgi:predicted ester cyclase
MSAEELKAIYHRLNEEVWNERNFASMDKFVSPDLVLHLPDGTESTFEEYKRMAMETPTAFPDFHYTLDHVVAEGDTLAAHFTFRGTHTGPLSQPELDPTGKTVTTVGMGLYRFEEGKIAEMWLVNDWLGYLQQLGAIPPPGEG